MGPYRATTLGLVTTSSQSWMIFRKPVGLVVEESPFGRLMKLWTTPILRNKKKNSSKSWTNVIANTIDRVLQAGQFTWLLLLTLLSVVQIALSYHSNGKVTVHIIIIPGIMCSRPSIITIHVVFLIVGHCSQRYLQKRVQYESIFSRSFHFPHPLRYTIVLYYYNP